MGVQKLQPHDSPFEIVENDETPGSNVHDTRLLFVKNRIESFIEKLSGLNQLDKYWARTDAAKALEQTNDLFETVKKLEKKYSFYDQAGTLRNEICKKAPDGNGNSVCNIIDSSILNVSSEGRDRSWKLEELKTINKSIDSLQKEKDITQFMQRHEELADTVVAKILMLFDSTFAEQFKQFQEEMGAPQFWAFTRAMSPAEFPSFTTTFNFRVPRDFLKNITRKNLSEWPKKLRKALTRDAEEILSSVVFHKTRTTKLALLKSSKTLADFISRLLDFKYIRDTEELKLHKEEKVKQQQEEQEKVKKEQEKKKEDEKQEEMKKKQEEKEAHEKEKTEEQKKKKEEKNKEAEQGEGLSEEKKTILDFYERSISHAEKVIRECSEWGIRPDDIDFWGQEGVKNRVHILKKRGLWKEYVKFNSNDKYIPSTARGDGFRFRWLNANTGSRISAAGAESGMRYMKRYKESGYQLCVLAGAFSIDWAGSDSPVYTPVQFLEKMHGLKNELMGKKID